MSELDNKDIQQDYPIKEKIYNKRDEDDEDDDKNFRGKDGEGKYPKKNAKYKRKVCKFCADKTLAATLDYKRVDMLERFITNRGKILPRRITGTCAKTPKTISKRNQKSKIYFSLTI